MEDASLTNPAKREIIRVENLALGYGDRVILEDLNFGVHEGEIITILGGSGSGKSTLLKGLIGLLPPVEGKIFISGNEVSAPDSAGSEHSKRKIGVLFQSGALLGSYTLGENVALPLQEFDRLPQDLIDEIVRFKLELVRLGDAIDYLPAELSGGMRKRAGLARAMALDPEILFCDEPSAGLDPVTAAEMDQLLLELNRNMGITIVVITHELASIETISHRCIMVDGKDRKIIAIGSPEQLKSQSKDPRVQAFFRRQAL